MIPSGFESLRNDRRKVTLPTEPFDTLSIDTRFSASTLAIVYETLLLATESQSVRGRIGAVGLLFAVAERNHAVRL